MSYRLIFLVLLIPLAAYAAPSGERLQYAIDGPLVLDPVRDNDAVGLTPVAAVSTENLKKTRDDIQFFTVANTHPTNTADLCFGTVSAIGATCNDALCGTASAWTSQGYAAIMNCTHGSSSQGSLILPRTSRTFRYDGTRCGCVVGNAASVQAQVERIVR